MWFGVCNLLNSKLLACPIDVQTETRMPSCQKTREGRGCFQNFVGGLTRKNPAEIQTYFTNRKMLYIWGRTITRLTRVPGLVFFLPCFCQKHWKTSENGQKWHLFFLRESQVARNSGDIPV